MNIEQSLHPVSSMVLFISLIVPPILFTSPAFILVMLVFILSFIGLRNGLSRLNSYLLIFVFFFVVSFIVNFIFTNTGTTVIFQIDELPLIGGHKRLSLEMLVFTFTASLRLVYIFLVFVFVMQISSEDRVMAFFSKFLKNFPLLLSFTVRLMPKLRSDYKRLMHVFKLRGFEVVKSIKERKGVFRRIKDSINPRLMLALIRTLLMNSLEDSLQYAEAMQSRGYGDYSSRSVYYKERFGILDGLLLSLSMVYLGLCIGLSAIGIGIKGIYPIFRLNHYFNINELLGIVLLIIASILLYINSYYIIRK